MIKFFFFSILGLLLSCTSVKNVPVKEQIRVDEVQQKVQFFPATISQEISADLDVSITPIDAKAMNRITYEATLFDGDYEKKQTTSTTIEETLKSNSLSKEERNKIELRKQIIDFVEKKIQSGEIPKVAGERLSWKLWNKLEGIDGSETRIGRGYPNTYNPFLLDNKYLSVFQIKFQNKGSSVKRLKLSDIFFNSGVEQLYPFETSYFEKLYTDNQEKTRIIYRLYMPSEMTIPPNESIVKYVSIPSLNPTIQNLDVKIIRENTSKNYSFSVKFDASNQTTILEKVNFKALDEEKLHVLRYYLVLLTSDGQVHILKDNSIFLPTDLSANEKISIFGIATLPTGYAFTKNVNLTFGIEQSKEIFLNFSEVRDYVR